ncbi:MAG: MarR family transcriptional regulator [Candidatus Korobacteraceae bacterium]
MTNKPSIQPSDYQALAEFRHQIRRFLHFSEKAARQAGIEPQHHQLMLAIKGKLDGGGPRIAYLAERLQVEHHSAGELVDRLVRKGLISRVRSPQDRREVHVELTPRGARILEELTVHTRKELRSAAPALVASLRDLAAPRKARQPLRRRRPKTLPAGRSQ